MLLSPTRLSQILKSEAAKTVVLDSTWFMPSFTATWPKLGHHISKSNRQKME
jgi:hypothetical protein